jgi:hypothetical protein
VNCIICLAGDGWQCLACLFGFATRPWYLAVKLVGRDAAILLAQDRKLEAALETRRIAREAAQQAL